jgi:hypothetical protein
MLRDTFHGEGLVGEVATEKVHYTEPEEGVDPHRDSSTPTPARSQNHENISGNYYDRLTIGGDSRVVAGNVHGDVHFHAVKPEGALLDSQ